MLIPMMEQLELQEAHLRLATHLGADTERRLTGSIVFVERRFAFYTALDTARARFALITLACVSSGQETKNTLTESFTLIFRILHATQP